MKEEHTCAHPILALSPPDLLQAQGRVALGMEPQQVARRTSLGRPGEQFLSLQRCHSTVVSATPLPMLFKISSPPVLSIYLHAWRKGNSNALPRRLLPITARCGSLDAPGRPLGQSVRRTGRRGRNLTNRRPLRLPERSW